MSEIATNEKNSIKVGYFSMGLSSILAGVLLVLNQMNYEIFKGIYILWPSMMMLLGLEIIFTQLISSLSKDKPFLKPAWGVIIICSLLVGCSQLWLILLNISCINW
ncbi:MAG: hypothetical protein AB1Z23_00120 [Eubacteriales bacterium]